MTSDLTSSPASQAPGAATEVTEAVSALLPGLGQRGAEIEAAGRLPDDIAASLRAAGVFRLWLPAELGGAEAEPAVVLDVLAAIAAEDGSAGWCAAIGLASNLIAGYLPRDGAQEVFATGQEVIGGSLMPSGQASADSAGNLTVSGRWPFASGAHHCDWLGGVVMAPGPSLVLMRRAEVRLLDNWQVSGLRGTGSVDFEADAVRVPARRVVPLAAPVPWPAGPMWRIPLYALLLPVMAAVPLGIGRGAIAALTGLAVAKTPFRSATTLAERESAQRAVAMATASVEAPAAFLAQAMTALFDAARRGAAPALAGRALARLAAVHATQGAADAVLACYRAAGSTAIAAGGPFERRLRDVNTATQHYALSPSGYESAGKVLLGLAPDVPL